MLEASATALMLPAETVFSETLMLPIVWDFSSVDLTCPGQYRATALMHMPSGFPCRWVFLHLKQGCCFKQRIYRPFRGIPDTTEYDPLPMVLYDKGSRKHSGGICAW